MSPTHAQLSELVALITGATKVVEAHYAKTSKPYVPSLDDIEPHPLDFSPSAVELSIAVRTIEGACAQLVATVTKPAQTLFSRAQAAVEPACLTVVTTNMIPVLLQEQPKKGMHISEISKRTGLHERKLARIMRHLVTRHVFREITDGVFANNRLSVNLVQAHNPGMANLVQFYSDDILGAASCLKDVLADKEWGHSEAPNHTAWNKRTGYPKGLFDYCSGQDSAKGAELGASFAKGVAAWANVSEGSAVIDGYPWKNLRKGTTFVDVGTGLGAIPMQLAKRYPELRFVLQDLPERVTQAKDEVWSKEFPEPLAEGRVQFKAFDFLKESPVPGAGIYYLKHIMLDWEDDLCVTILRNIRNVMSQGSRILIHEYVLQDATRNTDGLNGVHSAPEPLLPNFGVGATRAYAMDISVMIMCNSMQRRLPEFVALGERADLKFVKLWNIGETHLVEFAPGPGSKGRVSGKL